MRNDYWEKSTQPLHSFCLVAPLLLVYEFGFIWLGPEASRNGADVWLRSALAGLGFAPYLLLPLATGGLLLGWHHMTSRSWRFQADIVCGMACESVLLGLAMLVFAQAYAGLAHDALASISSHATSASGAKRAAEMLGFLGAGIYEEFLFRLVLLSGLIGVCRRWGADARTSTIVAIFVSSLLFSSAHYQLFVGVGGDFSWYSFGFRFAAGGIFSVLFLQRGFGITVGAHAAYDLLVVCVG